jgi:hypothetical protein
MVPLIQPPPNDIPAQPSTTQHNPLATVVMSLLYVSYQLVRFEMNVNATLGQSSSSSKKQKHKKNTKTQGVRRIT